VNTRRGSPYPALLALTFSALAAQALRLGTGPARASPFVASAAPAIEGLRDAVGEMRAEDGCGSYRSELERVMCRAWAAQAPRP